jgi:G:T/U-mismatch repair DNA glycosylase
LADANHLLAYAVEAGIEVERDIVEPILAADKREEANWQAFQDAGALLTAITRLAKQLHPVTAETLRACREQAHTIIKKYEFYVFMLAIILVPASISNAVYTGLTDKINLQIDEGNELVLQLNSSPLPPADRLFALQQLTIRTREIENRAHQLNFFLGSRIQSTDTELLDGTERATKFNEVCPKYTVTDRIELPSNINIDDEICFNKMIGIYTRIYQDVRYEARSILDNTSVLYGAISATILPIIYAMLGAVASVLLAFKRQLETRTFDPSYASHARFVVAAIAGGVIGLFNFVVGKGATVSPLALAFLVGFSTDTFFASLEKRAPALPKLPTPKPKPTVDRTS